MQKIEDILKSKGLSDADIAAMSTLLSNQSYRTALEASYSELETERDTYKQRDAEWESMINEKYVPAVTAAEQKAINASLEAAKYKAIAQAAKDFGYVTDDGAAAAAAEAERVRLAANPQQGHGFNPDDPKFREFANRFSMGEGDAMALYNYVAEEYRLLNGGSLNDYTGRDGKRGMLALRAEALAAKKPIDQYANEKFNWDGKRAEQAAKRQADHDAEISRKAVEEYALKHGTNPMTATPNPSRMPLMPTKVNDGKPVQPWDRPMATAERRQRAYEAETRARTN
jgi:hypothetical protein